MFKKIVSSMILLLCAISLYAASIDLGKVSPITVSGAKTSEEYASSGASVVVITADDIAKLHAQSTSQVLETVSSVSITNYGYMGSIQNINIRGVGAPKTEVYLNGAPTNMAYDTQFAELNVDAIPVEMIERIEIITSGADKNGKSFAAGGVVNIVTKKGNGEKSFAVSFENGSFLPLKANGAKALIDSQRLVVSGTDSIGDFDVAYSINHDRASNNYAYKYNDQWYARENAEMWDLGGTLNITGNIGEWSVSSLNLASYVNAGSPGSVSYGLTPNDHEYAGFVSTANTVKKDNITATVNYAFNPFYYEQHSEYYGDSITEYKAHNGSVGINGDFALSENLSTSLFTDASFDYAKSTNIKNGNCVRFTPSFGLSMAGNIKGLKIYPMGKLGYATDMEKFIPEGSLGLEYDFDFGLTTTADLAYAVRMPSFSELFWDDGFMYGNADLKPESGLSADVGLTYANTFISYNGSMFLKSMSNEINWVDWIYTDNIDKSFYWGFDQTVSVKYQGFNASIGWLFNKSYNLSEGRTFADNYAMDGVRKHTLTFTAGYDFGKVSVNADAKYYGKYNVSGMVYDKSNYFLMNLGVDYKPFNNFSCYAKIDNLLNTQYQLQGKYPIPGLKLRLGGNYKF